VENALRNSTWEDLLVRLEHKLANWTFHSLESSKPLGSPKICSASNASLPILSFGSSQIHPKSSVQSSNIFPLGRSQKGKEMGPSKLGKSLSTQTCGGIGATQSENSQLSSWRKNLVEMDPQQDDLWGKIWRRKYNPFTEDQNLYA
jgi:hypothetical protein